jgi:hypothetical protein
VGLYLNCSNPSASPANHGRIDSPFNLPDLAPITQSLKRTHHQPHIHPMYVQNRIAFSMTLAETLKQPVVYQVAIMCWMLRRLRKAGREYLTASACLVKEYTGGVKISVLYVHWRAMIKACQTRYFKWPRSTYYDSAC